MQEQTIRRIQEVHGHVPRLAATSTAVAVCDATYGRVRDAEGFVPPGDGRFLLSLIERAEPRHILEIGVASGVSSWIMLNYLDAAKSEATLTSVDVLEHYYGDPTKPLAFLVLDNVKPLPPRWQLLAPYAAMNFIDAPALAGQPQERRYDFVLIDAHHGHPWPTLDALCVLPFVKPGTWVALHDVSLTIIDAKWNGRGPQFLLQQWPGETYIADEELANIGAIRLSDAGPVDAARLLDALDAPWDCRPHDYWEGKIMKQLRTILDDRQLARVTSAFERHADLALV